MINGSLRSARQGAVLPIENIKQFVPHSNFPPTSHVLEQPFSDDVISPYLHNLIYLSKTVMQTITACFLGTKYYN